MARPPLRASRGGQNDNAAAEARAANHLLHRPPPRRPGLDGTMNRTREHGHFTDNRALPKKKGFRLEHRKPFASYFLNWLRGSDLN